MCNVAKGHCPPEAKVDTVPRTLVVKCGQNIAIEIPYKGQHLHCFIDSCDCIACDKLL